MTSKCSQIDARSALGAKPIRDKRVITNRLLLYSLVLIHIT
jgi:hypothetical protein